VVRYQRTVACFGGVSGVGVVSSTLRRGDVVFSASSVEDLRLYQSTSPIKGSQLTASGDENSMMSSKKRLRIRNRNRKPHNRAEKRIQNQVRVNLNDRTEFPALSSIEVQVLAPVFEETYRDALTMPKPILRMNIFRKKGRLFALSSLPTDNRRPSDAVPAASFARRSAVKTMRKLRRTLNKKQMTMKVVRPSLSVAPVPKASKISTIPHEIRQAVESVPTPSEPAVPTKSVSFSGLFKQGILCLLPEFKLKSWIADHGLPAPTATLSSRAPADARSRFSSLSRNRVLTWKTKRNLKHL